jgi:PmbA protein
MTEPATVSVTAHLIRLAQRAGAEQCDAIAIQYDESEVTVRRGEVDRVVEAGSAAVGLRVIIGGRTAICSSSDLGEAALERLAVDTVELARISAPDPFAGLPDPSEFAAATDSAGLQLYDERIDTLSTQEMIASAVACEDAAFRYDARITNSDGAQMSRRSSIVALANSLGFRGTYPTTTASLMVEVMADDDEGKKRNAYWYTTGRSLSRLQDAAEVGRIAARRAVDQLGARKVGTRSVPTVFEPMMVTSLMGHLAACSSGTALYRGSTLLKDREGQQVGSSLVTIIDDPLLPGRGASRPFDSEGVATRRNPLMESGVFRGFLLDVYTARRTSRATTGSAGRAIESLPAPGPTNLVWSPGGTDPAAMIADIREGFFVTSLMGHGFNPVTGDYSRGAAGFWIEGGRLAYPVTEVNISGRFDSMLAAIDAVGDDVTWFGSAAAPSVRFRELMVSGL